MLTAIIMAGGSGERFWPLSTPEKPKQLLKIFSEKTMIRETVDRILPIIKSENIFIATNIIQAKEIEKDYINNSQSKLDLPVSNVIQYILEDGTYITVRPSGTEPKIKYYIYTKGNSKQEADKKLDLVLNEFKEYMESLK